MAAGVANVFRNFRSLASEPVGWVAAGLLFLANWAVSEAVSAYLLETGYASVLLFSHVVVIALFAVFMIFTIRHVLAKRIALGRARIGLWLALTLAESLVLGMIGAVAMMISYMAVSGSESPTWVYWLDPLIRSVFSTLLVGLYVWKMALLAGESTISFGHANRFVWSERKWFPALYLVIMIASIAMAFAMSSAFGDAAPFRVGAAVLAFDSFVTWLAAMLLAALFLDLIQNEHPLENVFS